MLELWPYAGLLLPTAHGYNRIHYENSSEATNSTPHYNVPVAGIAGTIHLDIKHSSPHIGRRDGTPSSDLANNLTQGGYLATVQVGTPGQYLTLIVDTGSSDTWVPWSGAQLCQEDACYFGDYDPNKSSTYQLAAKDGFRIAYGDGSGASGDYITDAFQMGDVKLDSLQIGLGENLKESLTFGLVGLGFPANEAIDGEAKPYPNLPMQLKDKDVIATTAYSLWLDDLRDSSGSILFGGIDTNRFLGDALTRVKMYPSNNNDTKIIEFNIAFTSLMAISPSGTDHLASESFPMRALLDSGTTLSFLPADLTNQIFTEAGVVNFTNPAGSIEGAIPCDTVGSGYLSFGFGGTHGAVINVTLNELIIGPTATPHNWPYGNRKACLFGVSAADEGDSIILGDSFLRSAYVVYDMENFEVGLGQTNFNDSVASVVPFPSEKAVVPSSTPAPSQDLDQLQAIAVSTAPTSYVAKASFTGVASVGGGSGGMSPGKNAGTRVLGAVSGLAIVVFPLVVGVSLL